MRWTDWILVACAISLVVLGPVMALQELAKLQDERATRVITGAIPPPDVAFRASWRLPLAILVIASAVSGIVALARALVEPGVRSVSWRVVALLAAGLALLAAAYWIDGALLSPAPYALRASVVSWLYPLAGILLAGSARRLAELQDHFGLGGRAAEFRI